jgi:pimeloyl-ACP methyl ester carboxylesterase
VSEHARIGAATDPLVYADQARAAASYDYGTKLGSVTNPVLILQGEEDRLTSPGGSVILSRALPNAELRIVPGIGHNAHIELGATFVEMVRAFLARHDLAFRP